MPNETECFSINENSLIVRHVPKTSLFLFSISFSLYYLVILVFVHNCLYVCKYNMNLS